jgi:DNA-binding XRE family transcriptional regulator
MRVTDARAAGVMWCPTADSYQCWPLRHAWMGDQDEGMPLAIITDPHRTDLPAPEVRRRVRREAGLTLAEVGRLLGVTGSTVSRWERGTMPPEGASRLVYAALLRALSEASEDHPTDE